MQYKPSPIDTENVRLPESLASLVETMAKNVHEVWAYNRMQEGRSYGEDRNDAKKTHPCLVPYDELPEAEKDYDRETAVSTLKLIIKLGFNISAK